MLDLHTVCVPTTYTCTVTSWTGRLMRSSEFIFTLGTVRCFLGELEDAGRFKFRVFRMSEFRRNTECRMVYMWNLYNMLEYVYY